MNQIFDTHEAFRALTASGIAEKQSEAIVTVLSKAVDLNVIATKADLKDQTQSLTIRFGGMLAVAVAALATILKLA